MPKIELNACVSSEDIFSGLELNDFDALYLGQPYCLELNGNFLLDTEALKSAVHSLKEAGKKAYLTTPAIPLGSDLPGVVEALKVAAEAGIDAVEAHDVGVFRLIRREFPELRVHVGNFANTYNEKSAALWKRLGAARIVPSHELTQAELALITAVGGVEFERPVHGPLPLGMAYACVLRRDEPDGAPGPCLQQCSDDHYLELDGWRMRCAGTTLLTGEDYCLLEHMPGFIATGLAAVRLETYFESADKINALGAIYRRALEAAESGGRLSEADLLEAEALAARGLCNGWNFGKSGREYISAAGACV